MSIRVSTKFKKTYGKMNLTEQGGQVAARMLDHIQTYEYHARKRHKPGQSATIRAEVLLSKGLRRLAPTFIKEEDLRNEAVETIAEVYLDLLHTYWEK